MNLVELPPEILLVVLERLPNVKTLYNLTQTSTSIHNLYWDHADSILDHVIANAYPGCNDIVHDVVRARRSNGELDYSYIRAHCIEWIVPRVAEAESHQNGLRDPVTNVLECFLDLENDVENLADWCAQLCARKTPWHDDPGTSTRRSVMKALLQLHLIASRLYNVRMPAFPDHVSLRTYETKRSKHYTSRKTKDQAQDLIEDQLRTLKATDLRRMWVTAQVLQDQYLLLRRHRLHPYEGSLMDLLFAHNSDKAAWSISPWTSVQRLLSRLGYHVISARPGTSELFLGYETPHELQQKDINEFNLYFESLSKWGGSTLADYLERFRPLMGLPYLDTTPVWDKVEPRNVLPAEAVRKPFWEFGEQTETIDCSPLGRMLDECADRHQSERNTKS